MNSGFYVALTGAKTHQDAIDTTANNIANFNTIGYRASRHEFATLFSRYLAVNSETLSSDDGIGVRTSATTTDMRLGAFQQSDNVFDLAIVRDGWFGVVGRNPFDSREIAYTRAGTFGRDSTGYLVTQTGNYVLGSSWGNLINENGSWRILPSAAAGNIADVAAQRPIAIPPDIYFPPIATKVASLNANMPNLATSTRGAAADAKLGALYDSFGQPLAIASGQNLLVSAGDNADITASGGEIAKIIETAAFSSPITFELNGAQITANWAAGAGAADIALAVSAAINASGAARSVTNGGKVTILSQNSLELKGGGIAPCYAEIYALDPARTIGDLANKMQSIAQKIYTEARAILRYDGSIAIDNNNDSFSLLVTNGGGATANVLSNFAAFNGLDTRKAQSAALKEAAKTASERAIAPNGDMLIVESQTRLITPATAAEGAIFAASAALKKEETLNGASAFTSIVSGQTELGLKGGEDFWAAFGKQPASTEAFLGYSMGLASDQADGIPPRVSFTLDGVAYAYAGADGDNVRVTIAGIQQILRAAGYESEESGAHLIIKPKGDSLHFASGASNLPEVVLQPMSMVRAVYQAGENAADFLSRINAAAQLVGASAAIEGGKIVYKNTGASQIETSIHRAFNTPENLYSVFSSLNQTLLAGASAETNAITTRRTLSAADTTIRMDTSGNVASGGSVTLNNGGEALAFTFNIKNDNALPESARVSADGVVEGHLKQYGIDKNGRISAFFTNGEQRDIGQIAIYNFINDQGLMRIDGTMFTQSPNSGAPFFYLGENGELISEVSAYMLEGSNAQSSETLTDLIIFQRSFESSAKAITTNDQLIQNAIGMKK
ncbi:MAG: flagellar hook-basal body complex protein [Helicobacteraceae bacterium]|jgi:flagellar hook-basal body protein|nr:flagellar hook-basal body complex protein [Helicobacteraceae bacterium]